MNHGGSGVVPGQGDGTPVTDGIAVRVALVPDGWEVLRGFRTFDPEWARAVANRIGRAIVRPVRLRVAVVDPFCPVHRSAEATWQAGPFLLPPGRPCRPFRKSLRAVHDQPVFGTRQPAGIL
jgi:hypothetical protein